jgi:hypothetical protein
MKGYGDRREQHTAFALKQLGQTPEAIAGIPLGFSDSWALTATQPSLPFGSYWQKFARTSLSCSLLSCALLIYSIPGALASETEWVFSQQQAELGRYKVFIVKDAVKVVNETLGYEVVAKAPAWTVVIYRPAEKTGYESELFLFRRFQIFGFINEPRKAGPRPLTKLETQEQNGLRICKYKTPNGLEETWSTDSTDAAPQISDIVETCYRLKFTPGIPLRVISYQRQAEIMQIPTSSWMSGGVNMWHHARLEQLKTFSWKKVPYHSSDFTYPTDYKHVKDPRDLVFSKKKKSTMDDLARDLGIGEKLGSPEK